MTCFQRKSFVWIVSSVFFFFFKQMPTRTKPLTHKKHTDKDMESDTSIPKQQNTHKHSVKKHLFVTFTMLNQQKSDPLSHNKHPELSFLSVEISVQTGSTTLSAWARVKLIKNLLVFPPTIHLCPHFLLDDADIMRQLCCLKTMYLFLFNQYLT